jgi:D-glycero-D-manno-heptose 1,7-bisphosphate phosphatase
MFPAIFLDRDGVIVENRVDYILSWKDIEIFPQALHALSRIETSQYKIIIITNQSAIGRGVLTQAAADEINERLLAEIRAAGGRVDGIFLCPHSPADHCSCRKPLPGLILQAAEKLTVDLSKSIMIGDAITDLRAGIAAGIKTLAIVKTGRGAAQIKFLSKESDLSNAYVFNDLSEAISMLLK